MTRKADSHGRYECRICKEWKGPLEFSWNQNRPRTECKACRRTTKQESSRVFTLAHNPDAIAEYARRVDRRVKDRIRRYGLSVDEYAMLWLSQSGKCAICGATGDLETLRGLVVDHDHATGKVRGLLCSPCNSGIGYFRDYPHLMRAAAMYVNKHHKMKTG